MLASFFHPLMPMKSAYYDIASVLSCVMGGMRVARRAFVIELLPIVRHALTHRGTAAVHVLPLYVVVPWSTCPVTVKRVAPISMLSDTIPGR